jgi:hypothetical protein
MIDMPKKIVALSDYITASDAALILSQNSGHPISSRYIGKLSKRKKNRVRTQEMGNRLLYNREDILASSVRQKKSTPE